MSIENQFVPHPDEIKFTIEGGGDTQELIRMHDSLTKWKEENKDLSFVYPSPQNEKLVLAYPRTAAGDRAKYPLFELRWDEASREYMKSPSSFTGEEKAA